MLAFGTVLDEPAAVRMGHEAMHHQPAVLQHGMRAQRHLAAAAEHAADLAFGTHAGGGFGSD